eukprot:1038023-Rhodomonas_salina.1
MITSESSAGQDQLWHLMHAGMRINTLFSSHVFRVIRTRSSAAQETKKKSKRSGKRKWGVPSNHYGLVAYQTDSGQKTASVHFWAHLCAPLYAFGHTVCAPVAPV